MTAAYEQFVAAFPEIKTQQQGSDLNEQEREQFLAALSKLRLSLCWAFVYWWYFFRRN